MKKAIGLVLVFLLSHGVSSAVVTKVKVTDTQIFQDVPPDSVYDTKPVPVYIDPSATNWIALSSADNLYDMPTGDNGNILRDGIPDLTHPNVDDYVTVTVWKGTNVSTTIILDNNDAYNCRIGNQAVIFGSYPSVRAVNCIDWSRNPPVVRWDTFPETGQLTEFFATNGAGEYTFTFGFVNKYTGTAAHGATWLLIDANQANRPPTISLAPDPAAVPDFQEQMARGLEFEIHMDDPDGVDDLDLSTFRVWVAGVDKTSHFLQTVMAHPSRLRQVGTSTGTTYYIRPDPQGLMTEFNYFNIQWNGKWPVSIGICDRNGACARADYTIYFGPYVTTESWLGQVGGGCVDSQNFKSLFTIGNNGLVSSSDTKIFLGLLRPSDGVFWTLALTGETIEWHWMAIVPVYTMPSFPSGGRYQTDEIPLGLRTYPDTQVIASGDYQFLMAAVDPNATDMLVVSKPAVICAH